jgi:hypothetical protein
LTVKPADEQDTLDIEIDTEDMEDKTEPDSRSRKDAKPIARVRMPSKAEIARAVDSVKTESLEVDSVTEDAAATPKIEDLD